MTMTDSVADLLTRIRNAAKAQKKAVDVPSSRLKKDIVKILTDLKFVKDFSELHVGNKGIIRIWLRYNKNDESIITGLERVSTPGLRRYVTSQDIFRLQQKVGTMIISTSRGVMTHQDALKNKIGGELICRVW